MIATCIAERGLPGVDVEYGGQDPELRTAKLTVPELGKAVYGVDNFASLFVEQEPPIFCRLVASLPPKPQ